LIAVVLSRLFPRLKILKNSSVFTPNLNRTSLASKESIEVFGIITVLSPSSVLFVSINSFCLLITFTPNLSKVFAK